jgi:hypothetical protein
VEVVHLGVNSEFRRGATTARELPHDYLLFSQPRAYKDFATALAAFAEIRTAYPELRLVAAGGGGLKTDELADIGGTGSTTRSQRIDVPDSELPAVFGAARVFLFPSATRGSACRRSRRWPAARRSSLPIPRRSRGSAAMPPCTSRPGIRSRSARRSLRILGDTALANGMVARGLERAAGFTWQRTAERTGDVYGLGDEPGRVVTGRQIPG